MVHLKVLELCRTQLMVHNYTTGPNNSTIYNRYIVQTGVTGVLSIVPIGRIGVTGVLAVTGLIYYYIINSIMALAHSETF